MGKPTKQWKVNGEQDKYIVKLIKRGIVNKYTKPLTLKNDYPGVFGTFTENVIRNHLNDVKRRNGLYCKFINELFLLYFGIKFS